MQRRAGIVADIRRGERALRTEHFDRRIAQRRAAAFWLDRGERVLRAHGKAHHTHRLVADLPDGRRLGVQHALLAQELEPLHRLRAAELLELAALQLAAGGDGLKQQLIRSVRRGKR